MMTGIPARTPNEKFTETQWQSIYQTGDNILVSASAGSGKNDGPDSADHRKSEGRNERR